MINLDGLWLKTLCSMLSSEYSSVIESVTQLIVFWIARASTREDTFAKVLQYLMYIKRNVNTSDYGEFCKNYFQMFISVEWIDGIDRIDRIDNENIDSPTISIYKLFVQFANCVFLQNNLNSVKTEEGDEESFFFLSDIQILFDMYERCLQDISGNSEAILWCLDGLKNILTWNGYINILCQKR